MQNILVIMCEKFHYDRLRNDRALWNGKSDNKNPKNNNKDKNNVCSHWEPPFTDPKMGLCIQRYGTQIYPWHRIAPEK